MWVKRERRQRQCKGAKRTANATPMGRADDGKHRIRIRLETGRCAHPAPPGTCDAQGRTCWACLQAKERTGAVLPRRPIWPRAAGLAAPRFRASAPPAAYSPYPSPSCGSAARRAGRSAALACQRAALPACRQPGVPRYSHERPFSAVPNSRYRAGPYRAPWSLSRRLCRPCTRVRPR